MSVLSTIELCTSKRQIVQCINCVFLNNHVHEMEQCPGWETLFRTENVTPAAEYLVTERKGSRGARWAFGRPPESGLERAPAWAHLFKSRLLSRLGGPPRELQSEHRRGAPRQPGRGSLASGPRRGLSSERLT